MLTTEPRLARDELSIGGLQFEKRLVEALRTRPGEPRSYLDIHAVTFMAASWFVTAIHFYLVEGRASLLQYFDEVVAACTRELAAAHLDPSPRRPR